MFVWLLCYTDCMGKLELVRARVRVPVRHTFTLRLTTKELDQIADAAEVAEVSVGAFIRQAALQASKLTGVS